jgi:hypothetical protein
LTGAEAVQQRVLVGFLATSIAFAGCASTESATPANLQSLEDLGAIAGVIVDEAISPVAGVAVFLSPGGTVEPIRNTTTDAAGEFHFEALDPDVYVLTIADARFQNTSQEATVRAGETVPARITLTGLPGVVPYSLVYLKSGLINCNIPIIIESLTCSNLGPIGPASKDFRHEIPAGHQFIVIEQEWPTNDESMTIWVERNYPPEDDKPADRFLIKMGQSVMRMTLSPEQSFCCSTSEIPKVPVPPSNQNFSLQLRSFYAGKYQPEVNQTLAIVCVTYYGSDACRGVGAALDFRFQQYVTAFVNYRPANAAEYSARPDA